MNKKILFAIFAAFILLFTVYAASAQTRGIDPNIDPQYFSFTINSTPDTTAVVDELYNYQVTVRYTNGAVPLTYSLINAPAGMQINQNGLISWTPQNTGVYSVNVRVSDIAMQPSIRYQQYEILVTSNDVVNPPGMLEIVKIKATVDGSRDTLSSPGDIDEEAEMGDEIELEIEIQNNFEIDDDETVIRDIIVELSSDLDDADGLEDEISRLRAGDDDTISFSFTLDDVDPSDAPFDIDVDVEGETDDGTRYYDSWTITLDMDVKSRDLKIVDVQINPTQVRNCADNRVRINVDVDNIGSRDLTNAAIKLSIDELDLSEFIRSIDLDSGDEDSYSAYLTIPAGVDANTYRLEVTAYPTSTTSTTTDVAVFDFTVLNCNEEDDEETGSNTGGNQNNNDDDTNNNGGSIIIPDITVSGTPVSSAVGRRGLFDSDSVIYFILLGGLILFLIIIIILLATRISRRD